MLGCRWLFPLALVGCGDDSNVIPIVVPGQPVLFAGRLDGGDWRTFTGLFDAAAVTTTYSVDARGDYELVMVCERDDQSFVAAELLGTADDAIVSIGSWAVPDCIAPRDGRVPAITGPTVAITGALSAAGNVAVGYTSRFFIANEPFSIAATTGRHDLIAHSNYQVLIAHDIDVSVDFDVGTIPVAERGSPMLTKGYFVTPTPLEALQVQTQLTTRNGTHFLWQNEGLDTAVFVPPDQLAAGDTQQFSVGLYSNVTARVATLTNFTNVAPDFEMLAQLAPVTVKRGVVGAHWDPIADFYTTVTVEAVGSAGADVQRISASKLWLDRHGLTELRFDTEAPHYAARWTQVDPLNTFTIERWSPTQVLVSETTQTVLAGT